MRSKNSELEVAPQDKLITQIRIVTHDLVSNFGLPEEYNHIYIIPISDMQVGDPGFDQQMFLGYRDWILERPNAFVVLPGDNLNTPTKNNKASDMWDEALSPRKARERLRDLFRPLADAKRILGWVDGNHEHRLWVAGELTGSEWVMSEIRVPYEYYDPDSLIIRVGFGSPSYQKRAYFTVYITHGWGGARRSGGQVNKIEELQMVVPNADVYIAGHEHTLTYSRYDNAFIPDDPTSRFPVSKRQVFVGSGTFCHATKFQRRIQRRLPNLGSPRIRLEYKQTSHRIEGVNHPISYVKKDIHVSF